MEIARIPLYVNGWVQILTTLNKTFGGRNTLMRETKIETEQGYLGT
jgi:hypothetical protein